MKKFLIIILISILAIFTINFEIVSIKTFKNNDNKLHGYIVKFDEPVAFLKNKNLIIKDFAIILK